MNNIVLLEFSTAVAFVLIFYSVIRAMNKKMRRFVLRFEEIKGRF
jgi:hypothetical protein